MLIFAVPLSVVPIVHNQASDRRQKAVDRTPSRQWPPLWRMLLEELVEAFAALIRLRRLRACLTLMTLGTVIVGGGLLARVIDREASVTWVWALLVVAAVSGAAGAIGDGRGDHPPRSSTASGKRSSSCREGSAGPRSDPRDAVLHDRSQLGGSTGSGTSHDRTRQ